MSTDHAMAGYRAGLDVGELRAPRCEGCDRLHWPPRESCPHCGEADLTWEQLPREAEIFTWTVVGRSTLEHFRHRTPYAVAVVAYPELGVRLVGGITDDPTSLRIGDPVRWDVTDDGAVGLQPRWTVVEERRAT